MYELIEQLKERCDRVGLKIEGYEDYKETIDHYGEEDDDRPYHTLAVQFPAGRKFKKVEFYDDDEVEIEWLLRQPFEDYRALDRYGATWSSKRGVIECNLLDGLSSEILRTDSGYRIHNTTLHIDEQFHEKWADGTRFEIRNDVGLTLSLGLSSDMQTILSLLRDRDLEEFESEEDAPKFLTLRIEGIQVSKHDEAVEILEKIGNSVLFQLDLVADVSLSLQREREIPRYKRNEYSAFSEHPAIRFEYDKQAMSLYWYAKSASEMPLLRFLANYQILEYYFPIYSKLEAQKNLRNRLKDPTFDVSSDADISSLLDSIKLNVGKRTFGSEMDQLTATIEYCVEADELRSFLISESEERYSFYTSEKPKKIVKEAVPVREESADHRNSAARRIYAIRNRIVHTKSSGENVEPLLPFDLEVAYLEHDIELAEYLAQKALIAASRVL